MKELARRLLWPFMVIQGGEMIATQGTLKFKILDWLYGEDAEPVVDAQWPNSETK